MKLIFVLWLAASAAYISARTITLEKYTVSILDDAGDDDQAVGLIEEALGTAVSSLQVDGCKNGKCKFCAGKHGVKVCFVAKLENNDVELELTFNGHAFAKTKISVNNPPPICKSVVPILHVTDVCIEFKNIDLKHAAGCVYVAFKIKLGPVHKKISFKVGCFRFKKSADSVSDDSVNDVIDIVSEESVEDASESVEVIDDVSDAVTTMASNTDLGNDEKIDYRLLFESFVNKQ